MNSDEKIVYAYLNSIGMGVVTYEPDGKVPPDFLVGERIAVEVRRLNQHYQADGDIRGLEEDTIPLRQQFENLLAEFTDRAPSASWFVMFNFRRPFPEWRALRPEIHRALARFLQSRRDEAWRIPISETFQITLLRASMIQEQTFLLGGYTDMDSGGWVVSEIVRNASAYMADKSRKVAPRLSKYPEWWLILVDYIGRVRDETEVRQHISRSAPWNRVLILNPIDLCAYEI